MEGLEENWLPDDAMNKSMNGNNLALPLLQQSKPQTKQKQNMVSPLMDDFCPRDYSKPPVPARRNQRRYEDTFEPDREKWKRLWQEMEEDVQEYKMRAERFQALYEKQKSVSEIQAEELRKQQVKVVQLETKCSAQETQIRTLNQDHELMETELRDRSVKLTETMSELNSVMMKSEDLGRKLNDFERQLQLSESARNAELENLRGLQGSFQASEKHFTTVLEQIQNLMHENELAYQTNCRLSKEKLKVERDLSLKNKMSSSLTAELAEAQEKMKQINHTLKSFEHEKDCLFKKLQEQRATVCKYERDLTEKMKQLEAANHNKAELENQLKLANLCLSRVLEGKNAANIFPFKSESYLASTSAAGEMPSIKFLQEQISAKDKAICQLIEENNELEDELERYKMELVKQKEVNSANRAWFQCDGEGPRGLEQELNDRERVIDSMKLSMEKAISERNRLGLKCLRRKKQAALLKEKNKVLEEIMLIGNRLYEEGLRKIRNIKMTQETTYGSHISMVGRITSQPTTPSGRPMMRCPSGEGRSINCESGEAAHATVEGMGHDMILNI